MTSVGGHFLQRARHTRDRRCTLLVHLFISMAVGIFPCPEHLSKFHLPLGAGGGGGGSKNPPFPSPPSPPAPLAIPVVGAFFRVLVPPILMLSVSPGFREKSFGPSTGTCGDAAGPDPDRLAEDKVPDDEIGVGVCRFDQSCLEDRQTRIAGVSQLQPSDGRYRPRASDAPEEPR